VLEDVENYRVMKEELRCKHAPSSVIDETTKNALIKRGRDQARASFFKKLASGLFYFFYLKLSVHKNIV